MKYKFISQLEINEGLGVHRRDPLPAVAILSSGKRILLKDEEGLYLPPSFEDRRPSAKGYWNFGDGIKLRRTEDGISSNGAIHYDYRGWIKIEVLAPAGTTFVMENFDVSEYS